MICSKCGGRMKVVAFLTEVAVVDRIIDHLKLRFVAAKPPPSHVFTEVALTAAEESGDYFCSSHFHRKGKSIVFQPVGRVFYPDWIIRQSFRDLSRLLTSPPGRGYSIGMDWRGDSSSGAGIQIARKKQILILLYPDQFLGGRSHRLQIVRESRES